MDGGGRVEARGRPLTARPRSPAVSSIAEPLDPDLESAAVFAGLLEHAVDDDPASGVATRVPREALGAALVGPEGALRLADERFARWIGDPGGSPACLGLLRRARECGAATGLVETAADGVIAVLATRADAHAGWRVLLEGASARMVEGAFVMLAFAPSRSGELMAGAARALGLTPLEVKVAVALLDAPGLREAAARVGVGVETAKEALAGAIRRVGVARASQLLGRIVDLGCGVERPAGGADAGVAQAMGLTASEARVMVALADGGTVAETAARTGLSAQTVKTYRRAIFQKTGVNRARDLRRLSTEFAELGRLAATGELLVDRAGDEGVLRTVTVAGRQIAFTDHGPARGRPVLVHHGLMSGRLVPPPLLAALRAAGRRAIAVQRPGFGLTSPAAGPYLEQAADDVARVLDRLQLGEVEVIGRDTGAAATLTFTQHHPERVGRVVLGNPMMPWTIGRTATHPSAALIRLAARRPAIIGGFGAMLAGRTRSETIKRLGRRLYGGVAVDLACLTRPEVADLLVQDFHGLLGRSMAGLVAELGAYAEGWRIPEVEAGAWTVVQCGGIERAVDLAPWAGLPRVRFVTLADAGWLFQFTHAPALVELVAASAVDVFKTGDSRSPGRQSSPCPDELG